MCSGTSTRLSFPSCHVPSVSPSTLSPSLAGCLPHTSVLFPWEMSRRWSHGDTPGRGGRPVLAGRAGMLAGTSCGIMALDPSRLPLQYQLLIFPS